MMMMIIVMDSALRLSRIYAITKICPDVLPRTQFSLFLVYFLCLICWCDGETKNTFTTFRNTWTTTKWSEIRSTCGSLLRGSSRSRIRLWTIWLKTWCWWFRMPGSSISPALSYTRYSVFVGRLFLIHIHIFSLCCQLLATCINYADSTAHTQSRFRRLFRCDVLFLQGNHNGFCHIATSA